MVEFLQFTLSGISFGMIYAAIALSLVLIWRGTRLLNFAQGGMAMFTTFIALEVIYRTGSYWAGFVVALAAGIVLGAAFVGWELRAPIPWCRCACSARARSLRAMRPLSACSPC